MIKATISEENKRNTFTKPGAKSIARGSFSTNKKMRGLVLEDYEVLASGLCSYEKIKNNELNNLVVFAKQKEVA